MTRDRQRKPGQTLGSIRAGIGGWTYAPWRGAFYPEGLAQTKELAFASRAVTAIEINSTFRSRQKPETFAKWRDATPDGFVFALKAHRFCTNRRNLAEAGEGVSNFLAQGITELGDRLGPILWQLAATKRFEAEEIAAFLAMLPPEHDGLPLRHAIEPRHESFGCEAFFDLARHAGVATVIADSSRYPAFAELTAPFVYVRLQDAREDIETGYDTAALDVWAERGRTWAAEGRDVFAFFINGAKMRAPAAAITFLERIGQPE